METIRIKAIVAVNQGKDCCGYEENYWTITPIKEGYSKTLQRGCDRFTPKERWLRSIYQDALDIKYLNPNQPVKIAGIPPVNSMTDGSIITIEVSASKIPQGLWELRE